MPESELTRLTIVWSKETDLALRSYLGAQGLKKGALSKFVEDAVKWRLFDQTSARFAKPSLTYPLTNCKTSSTKPSPVFAKRNIGNAKSALQK